MEWTSLNDLREKYLSFFESKGHMRLKSFSLVPNNDKSLLLINSGMAPMKKYFTGEGNTALKAGYNLPEVHKNARPLSVWGTPRATAHILKCSVISLSGIILRSRQ